MITVRTKLMAFLLLVKLMKNVVPTSPEVLGRILVTAASVVAV